MLRTIGSSLANAWHQWWRGYHATKAARHAARYHRHHPEEMS